MVQEKCTLAREPISAAFPITARKHADVYEANDIFGMILVPPADGIQSRHSCIMMLTAVVCIPAPEARAANPSYTEVMLRRCPGLNQLLLTASY